MLNKPNIYPNLEPIHIIDVQTFIDEIVAREIAKEICSSNSIQTSIEQFKKNI